MAENRKEPNPSHGKGGGDAKAKKKESILDLSKYLDKEIRVKFQGGREAQGILKGLVQKTIVLHTPLMLFCIFFFSFLLFFCLYF